MQVSAHYSAAVCVHAVRAREHGINIGNIIAARCLKQNCIAVLLATVASTVAAVAVTTIIIIII